MPQAMSLMTIVRDFEAAHRLPEVASEHKCHHIHGHTYRVEMTWDESPRDASFGAEAASIIEEVIARLTYVYINEVPGLENATSENIALWIWGHLAPRLLLQVVSVAENADAVCTYRGPL